MKPSAYEELLKVCGFDNPLEDDPNFESFRRPVDLDEFLEVLVFGDIVGEEGDEMRRKKTKTKTDKKKCSCVVL